MTKVMQPPANTNVGPSEIDDTALDDVSGAAETVHLSLTANGTKLDAAAMDHIEGYEVNWGTRISTEGSADAQKAREIVVVGSKVKDVVRN